MAILTSAGITFGDATTQSTAATAAALVTTANVLSATAGASSGAVGSYAYLATSQNIGVGSTVAGSNCRFAGSGGNFDAGSFGGGTSGTPSGTWRAMGFPNYRTICGLVYVQSTLYLRIS